MFQQLFAIFLFLTVFGIMPNAHAETVTERFTETNPPQNVPAITFEDGKGRVYDLKDFKGRYVVLNLWATWCAPCVKEMPSLNGLQKTLGSPSFHVLAVNQDMEGISAAEAFYKRHELKNLTIYANSTWRMPSLLKVRGLPTTLLIDPDGMEIGRVAGEADWSTPEALHFLKAKMKL